MRFEASGPAAPDLETVLFIPDHIREMAACVKDVCVLQNGLGGYVTRQIGNTENFLTDAHHFVDFDSQFRMPTLSNFMTHF